MTESGKNQAVIGAFVVGAVALVVAAVVVFGGSKLFRDTDRYVMYFDGSVKGLSIGAPVTFRGVKIGSVMDITLRADPDTLAFSIPVIVEIDKDSVERTSEIQLHGAEIIDRLVEKGLRAKLDIQSIITGQLLINLELMPDEPLNLSGIKHRYHEIPTVPTTFERIARIIEELPIENMVDEATAALKAIESVMNDPALPEMVHRLNDASANLQELTAKLNRRADPLVGSFQNIADQAGETFEHLKATVERIGRTADSISQLAEGARPAVDNAGQVMSNVAGMTDPAARERRELQTMINELSEAARAMRVLSEYLQRHPEALVRGKSKP